MSDTRATEPAGSGFVAGFAARHAVAASLLQQAFAPPSGFTARAPSAPRGSGFGASGVTGGGAGGGPRHFSPADPTVNPTAGWDPLDAGAPPSPFVDPSPAVDPIEAAHAAGYAEGLAAAVAAAQVTTNRDAALLTGIGAALSEGRIDREAMAAQLRQTVLLLVTRIVGDVGVAAERLGQRVEVAADLLADAQESAMLRVHPDDVPLLEGRLPTTIFAVGDASIARGSFVLESASTVVEDGPALWMEQLAAAIDRVALPA